jgi:transposase
VDGDGSPTAVLLGLNGFRVLAAAEVAGEVELLVETAATVVGCPDCGVVAVPKDRRAVTVRDLPVGGRPVVLVWHKRVWSCLEPLCSRRSWTETSPAVRPRATLTERARDWAFVEVGRKGRSTAEVARELGVGWATVWRTVVEKGTPVVEDSGRLDGVDGLGVDETAFLAATATSSTAYVTGIVDITRGRPPRLLDVVPGRSGRVYADWLAERETGWREGIRFAALDPFRGYATALRTELPDAVRVLDAFHVVRLGFAAVDEVRRRVQQETLHRRGHRDDPLYRIRRVLRRRADRLSPHARRRMETGLALGDPDGEVAVTWWLAQDLCGLYRQPSLDAARRDLDRLLTRMTSCPVPEVARLGRTLASWRAELLAYWRTGGASNGPTEAMNLLIEKIRRVGHGYRNFRNYRLRLLLHCGTDWHDAPTTRIRGRRPRFVA